MRPSGRPSLLWLNAETVPALLWFALGIFLTLQGRELGTGSFTDPGSGFLVFWGGALVAAFAMSLAGSGLRSAAASVGSLWADTRWGKVAAVVAVLLLYAALLAPLGFLLATAPLMLALLRLVDPVPWRFAIPIAAGATLGIWWLIERLLSVQLPKAAWGFG